MKCISDWIGLDVNDNLIDAMLLNTTRIGHGFAAAKNPVVLQYIMENNVALEVNPISNQVSMTYPLFVISLWYANTMRSTTRYCYNTANLLKKILKIDIP